MILILSKMFKLLSVLLLVSPLEVLGNKEVVYKLTTSCEPRDDSWWNYTVKTVKLSKKVAALTLSVVANYDIDPSVGAAVEISKMGNGGWKPNFYKAYIKDICNVFKNAKVVFEKFAKDSKRPPRCPLKKGYLLLENYQVNMEDTIKLPLDLIPASSYKAQVAVMKNNKIALCIVSYIDIV